MRCSSVNIYPIIYIINKELYKRYYYHWFYSVVSRNYNLNSSDYEIYWNNLLIERYLEKLLEDKIVPIMRPVITITGKFSWINKTNSISAYSP